MPGIDNKVYVIGHQAMGINPAGTFLVEMEGNVPVIVVSSSPANTDYRLRPGCTISCCVFGRSSLHGHSILHIYHTSTLSA